MATSAALMEYLTTTKIGEKGQLTVPKEFREDLGLGAGAPFAVLRMGDGLILLPEQQRFDLLCERINSMMTGARPEDVLTTLPETRRELFEARYRTARKVSQPFRRKTARSRAK